MSKTSLQRCDPEKERRWREVVRGHGRSGQSVREYCRGAGVKESAFYWWRRELARRSGVRKTTRPSPASRTNRGKRRPGTTRRRPRLGKPAMEVSVRRRAGGGEGSPFLPIQVLAGNGVASPAPVEIHLGDGRMICVRPGVDRQTLREVLGALEGRSC